MMHDDRGCTEQLRNHPIRIALFSTTGVSLRDWSEGGVLARETALYHELARRNVHTVFVTYGGADDASYLHELPAGSIVCSNRWGLPPRLYTFLLPFLHAAALRNVHLVKSNQIHGASTAVAAAKMWKKPVVVRGGYLWSEFVGRAHGVDSRQAQLTIEQENATFARADRIVVSTPAMVHAIGQRVPAVAERIRVIPNYVDTDLFSPSETRQNDSRKVCFVGRLDPQKNLPALLEAVEGLDLDLDIIGQGPLRDELASQAAGNSRVTFRGIVQNQQLPECLRKTTVFIMPSFYEGHPKALIEAMSCGLPAIATDVPGNRELIEHGINGVLCGTTSAEIRAALERLLADGALRDSLGFNARRYIVDHFSLGRVVHLEHQLYQDMVL